ncbi:MAG: HepT-like ribonuclease domain-containing protein [bacterium]
MIGEASRNIPDEVKHKYQDVDWSGIIGLRNRIAHEYFGVNLTIVWSIIEQELPGLKEQMKHILTEG